MLRLTKKADYGLMALKFLAERPDMPSLSAKDIAEAYGIPPQLLAKILQRLTKAGLLRSHAGTNGGEALSRAPEDITAFEGIISIDRALFFLHHINPPPVVFTNRIVPLAGSHYAR